MCDLLGVVEGRAKLCQREIFGKEGLEAVLGMPAEELDKLHESVRGSKISAEEWLKDFGQRLTEQEATESQEA